MGSKNYSSWSLRPWIFLRKVGFESQEQVIHFDLPDYQAQIAALSPSRRVPLLIDAGVKIGDSLAICEYAADCTGRGLPQDRMARALARSAAAEMHSGFQALRNECPMNVRGAQRRVPLTTALHADVARLDELWSGSRKLHSAEGPWLFGEFSIADAMFAPVYFRFRTYGAALAEQGASLSAYSTAYLQHALADPGINDWQQASEREGHPLAEVDEVGMSYIKDK